MNRNSNIAAANDTISIDTIPDSILKPRYECNNKGVFWIGVKTSRDGEVMEQEPIRLADPIKLIGRGKTKQATITALFNGVMVSAANGKPLLSP